MLSRWNPNIHKNIDITLSGLSASLQGPAVTGSSLSKRPLVILFTLNLEELHHPHPSCWAQDYCLVVRDTGTAPEQSTGPLGLSSCCLTLLVWTLSQYLVAQRACLFAMSRWRAVGLGTPWANSIIYGITSPRFSKRQLFSDIHVISSTFCGWKGDN